MKNLILVLGVISVVSFVGCYSRDDDYFQRQVEIEDAFVFDNLKNYAVGDTIYFDLNFSRYLEEEGYSSLLDIFETTGANEFVYSFGFSRFSDFSNDFVPITVAENFIFAEKGKINGESNQVKAVLNQEQDMYESRVGIILPEEGDFTFNANYYSIDLYPENVGVDKVYFRVFQRFEDLDSDRYAFTVTEQ